MRQVEAKDYRETDVEGTEAVLIGEKGRLRNFGLFLQRRGSFTRASSVGFTFIELIIIITIIGILATVAVFKGWGSTNPNALKVAIDQVITDMRFAQTMAMAKSVYVQVSFTSGSRIYRLGDEARQLPRVRNRAQRSRRADGERSDPLEDEREAHRETSSVEEEA